MPFNNIPIKNPGRYFEQFVKVLEPCKGGGGQQMALSPAISRRDDYRLGPSTSWGEDRHQSEKWRKAAKNWNDIFIEFPKMLTRFYSVAKNVDTFLLSFQKCWHIFIVLPKMLTRFLISSCQKCWHVFIVLPKTMILNEFNEQHWQRCKKRGAWGARSCYFSTSCANFWAAYAKNKLNYAKICWFLGLHKKYANFWAAYAKKYAKIYFIYTEIC